MTAKEEEFVELCAFGNLELCKALYTMNPDINISSKNEEAFTWACWCGHLNVAKWLLDIKPDINISTENENIFRFTCRYNRLDVAKWLLKIKPDINICASNDFAYVHAASYRYNHTMLFLLHYVPYYICPNSMAVSWLTFNKSSYIRQIAFIYDINNLWDLV